jgi:hypothetical protein
MERRHLSDVQRRMIAQRQGWRCNLCTELLPVFYHVDHQFALGNCKYLTAMYAPDKIASMLHDKSNLQVLCTNCHAVKTWRDNFPALYESETGKSKYFTGGPLDLAYVASLGATGTGAPTVPVTPTVSVTMPRIATSRPAAMKSHRASQP